MHVGKTWNKWVAICVVLWRWLWRDEKAKGDADHIDDFLLNLRVTAQARFFACGRLRHRSSFEFVTTIFLSLGLIFIPLMQLTGPTQGPREGIVNAMQIFLAVAVLVYSVVQGTSRYDQRADRLHDCGVHLKALRRTVEGLRGNKSPISPEQIAQFNQGYDNIIRDSENHVDADYIRARLNMKSDYNIGILACLILRLRTAGRYVPYVFGASLLVTEGFLICELLGITSGLIDLPVFKQTR